MRILDRLADLRTAFRPRPWPLERPRVLQFPVNDLCNSRCEMCHIWQRKRDDEISPDALRAALANPLFRDVVGVGVNGGEPTLRRDLAALVDALFDALPSLGGISLITNALVSKVVIPRIDEVAQVVAARGGHFDVMVSLDGVGEVHDRVRGRAGNFENAERVLDHLAQDDLVHNVRLGCTVVRQNVFGVEDLLEYAIARDVYVKYRLGIPHQRLYTDGLADPFALTLEERAHLSVFLENLARHYEPSARQQGFYRSLAGQIGHGAPRRAGCAWQHRGATLTSRGELAYCAVKSPSLGTLLDGADAETLWRDGDAERQRILNDECAGCTHDYEGLPDGPDLLRETIGDALRRSGLADANGLRFEARPLRVLHRRRRFEAHRRALGLGATSTTRSEATPVSAPRRVVLCGWYGTETLGDKAILGGVVAALRACAPDATLALASFDPLISRLTASQMPELDGIETMGTDAALCALSPDDWLVMAGGPLMAIDPLAEIEALFARAAELGIPAIVAGCGVGPLGHAGHDASIARILGLASAVIVRDEASLETARRLGAATGRERVAEDPAFEWLAAQRFERKPAPDGPPRLLLGLREWPYHDYGPQRSARASRDAVARFERALVEGLAALVEARPHLEIVPFPMCTNHHGGDDRWFYRRLLRGAPAALRGRIDDGALGRELSPARALEIIAGCDAAVAMRFHSLVFAASVGLPAFAIDYTGPTGKVGSLASRLGVAHTAPESLTSEGLCEQIGALLDERPAPRPLGAPRFAAALHDVFAEQLA